MRLSYRTREAVQEEATCTGGLVDVRLDEVNDQVVVHQLTGGDHRLDPLPQFTSGGDLRSQQVTGGQLADAKVANHILRLGSLAGAGRTEKDGVQGRVGPFVGG